ncbi:Diadenosine hexaphosphate hydrolase-like protein [Hapsidospora chrysogenum ATCC 11550]|uniref:Diadenosine hexaphosphate hydrolase-like protein n=1 Tax=Hapsidospora chrysogenum (strain ATCC 11550 / CBS 779.69 / DSM 880 / IAM 14645 / JCM 23072 / IMI 49137) TaxID=857340 RepID=A0A086T4X2_HAPC1|nr:Diadenosine hexaphosphate hydrolase-like protein [Hapsidospora chrysogenum ATCC 11550]
MASTVGNLFFSDQFAISCGTVSIDVKRSKVLLIRWQRTGEHMLPKGRKDLSETLEQTAKRETFEETGIRIELLPVDINTLATMPSSVEVADRPKAVIEPIALSQRVTQGVLKVIFWYVALADSAIIRQEGTQQENEEFDTIWTDFDHVTSVLSFDDDRRIAQAAIAAVRRGVVAAS